MKKLKFMSLVLAVGVAGTSLVGCGGTNDAEAVASAPVTDAVETSTEPDTSGFVGLADRTPITLTLFTADATEDIEFTDPVAQKITELTGVTLEITHPVGGDTQAVPLMIASGDYPDLIFAKGDTPMLIDAGGLLPLDEMIEEKGDNLKSLYGDMINRLKNSEEDPTTYTVGTYGVHRASWKTDGTMQLQHAVLKELGYPEIKTLEQYEDALKTYIAAHPQIDGQDTIGLTLMGGDWRWLINVGNVASAVAGIPDDGEWSIDDETETATYKYLIPEVKVFMKWLNHLNAEGLLDPESFTQKEDAFKAKIASGRVLGLDSPDWMYLEPKASLVNDGKADRTYAMLPVAISEDVQLAVTKDYGFAGSWGIGISSTSPNAERAFEFLDWMASDEAQVLVNWGLEGVNYTVDENGKRIRSAEEIAARSTDKDYSKKTGVSKYVYPFPQQGDGAIDATGNYYTINNEEEIINSFNEADKETLAAYGKKLWSDFLPTPEELGVSKHGQAWQYSIPSDSDLAIFQQKAEDYVKQSITQAILGSPDDFDKAWDEILAHLEKIGVQEANEQMTQYTRAKIAFWNN